jgi:hypothetical protein
VTVKFVCLDLKLHAFPNKTGTVKLGAPNKSFIHKSSNQIKFPAR